MREILYVWRESVRNSVQARDSLSKRESWKPCLYFAMLKPLNPALTFRGDNRRISQTDGILLGDNDR